MESGILTGHYALILILCLYGIHRVYHTFLVSRCPADRNEVLMANPWPLMTVQAPVYNEKYVIERLIDALVELEYPRDRLQIQIVDDSTDDCADIAAARIRHHQAKGHNIVHVRRLNRHGYKAGALADAMADASGDYIAIFDADFLPAPDFLKRALPKFLDLDVAVVQTRWQHLNAKASLLTRIQAMMLDAHFGVEQIARSRSGAFFNFNGTAGIWRRCAIDDAGGWQADTLTEDLDLSYRAQMKGWRLVFMPDLGCPGELPSDMNAFKAQQHRWAKGAIEVLKKLLASVWQSPLPLRTKIEASFHLSANLSYLVMLIDSVVFLIPSIHVRQQMEASFLLWLDVPLFVLASLSHAWFYLFAQYRLRGSLPKALVLLPALLATSIGLAVNNGRAVVEAVAGHATGFVRTPKIGSKAVIKRKHASNYRAVSAHWSDRLELLLAVFYSAYLVWAALQGYWAFIPFLALFAGGYFYAGTLSVMTRARQQP